MPSSPRPSLGVERLEPRDTPSIIAVGAQAGGEPEVAVFDEFGNPITSFLAYDASFRGGVRTAVGDVTGDGIPDIVTAPGAGGGSQINVYNGRDGQLVDAFFAYDTAFLGGVSVAVGEIAGREVIVTGAGVGGGPQVNVFDAATGSLWDSFFAFGPEFVGGVTVAVGDLYGDGRGAVVAAAGPGGGPMVSIFDGPTGELLQSYFAYDPGFHGGVTVAVGDVLGLGRDQVITGAGFGGGPQVNVYDPLSGLTLDSFFAYDPAFTGGVGVAVIPALGRDLLVTAPGPGGGPDVRVFDLTGFAPGVVDQVVIVDNFFAYDPFFTYGLSFGCGFGLWQPYFASFGFGYGYWATGYVPFFPVIAPFGYVAYDPYFEVVPDVYYVDPVPVDPIIVDPGVVYPDPVYVDPGYDNGGTVDDGGTGWGGYYGDWYYDDWSAADYGGGEF